MMVKSARELRGYITNKDAEARGLSVINANWWNGRERWVLLNDMGVKPTVPEFIEWYESGCAVNGNIPDEVLAMMITKYNVLKMGLL